MLGKLAKMSPDSKLIEFFFGKISELAKAHKKQVAVADIANKPLYALYEFGASVAVIPTGSFGIIYNTLMLPQYLLSQGIFSPKPSQIEKFFPHAANARRLFTARGITQEAERLREGSKLVYIGSPINSHRVAKYIRDGPSIFDKTQNMIYKAFIHGLDRSARIYKPTSHGWLLVSDIKTK
ncbi:hypothetical protein HZB97_00835 [Candidatus Gottesmanbacteria bacterium]|nr:hypothetical protein [Candidatus Gottesmanbacteria bacterium]